MGNDWKTKLYVRVNDPRPAGEGGQGLHTLTPIVDITPTFNTPHTVIHSTEADNVGVVKGNDTYTFVLTVEAVRDNQNQRSPAKVMSELQLKHIPFDVVLVERDTESSQGLKNWGFDEILLNECYVNSGSPSRVNRNGQPTAVFNCIALRVGLDGVTYNGTLQND